MKTILEVRRGRDFSARNLGMISLEPEISFPPSTLGAYRLKGSFSASKDNLSGSWPELQSLGSGEPDYDAISSTSKGASGYLAAQQRMPAGSKSICGVVWCGPEAVTRTIGGHSAGPGSYNMLLALHASGTLRAVVNDTSAPSVFAEAPYEVGRWEFVAGVMDTDTDTVSVYIPRLERSASSPGIGSAGLAASTARVGGNATATFSGALRSALVSFHGTALSESEINDYYQSVKASLAAQGIDI